MSPTRDELADTDEDLRGTVAGADDEAATVRTVYQRQRIALDAAWAELRDLPGTAWAADVDRERAETRRQLAALAPLAAVSAAAKKRASGSLGAAGVAFVSAALAVYGWVGARGESRAEDRASLTVSGASSGNGTTSYTPSGTCFTAGTLGVGIYGGGGFGLPSSVIGDIDDGNDSTSTTGTAAGTSTVAGVARSCSARPRASSTRVCRPGFLEVRTCPPTNRPCC